MKKGLLVVLITLCLGIPTLYAEKNTAHYRKNGDGTVKDTKTGILWQEKDGGEMNWEEAKSYCKNLKLGGQEWRLPSIEELRTLVEGCKKGRIGGEYCASYKGSGEKGFYWQKGVWDYQGDKYGFFWSSSPYIESTAFAWVIHFYDGSFGYSFETIKNFVRCTGAGQ
ncbi:MAG TPA: hypothetical protein DHW82_00855 [Spirochaetia bacterium]|nr:MAG: hypothetical protein A2Y41_07955 [Spirochaetes bacterium GWB1_36_13]HCL55547.1 hypothetical protein [Spirochaetia bacterium]